MAEKTPGNLRDTCPRCGSTGIDPVRIWEHSSCGAIRPEAEFRGDGGITCPDCESMCEDTDDVTKGNPATCSDCGCNFDRSQNGRGTELNDELVDDAPMADSIISQQTALKPQITRIHRSVFVITVVVVLVFGISMFALYFGGGSPAADSENTVEETTWNEYQSIVIFRNDDIQPYYRTEEMEAVDQTFIDNEVPVTQGVIPATGDEELNPDGELCQYLRTQAEEHPGTFEFAVHGYTHEQRTEFHGGSELGGLPPNEQQELIQDGTTALSSCINETPTTYVPPFNTYDNATAAALADEEYTVVSGGAWFTEQYYNEIGPFEDDGLLHLPTSQAFVKNWTTNEFHEQAHLETQFDEAYQDGDVYVQMLHYQMFTDQSKLDQLQGLIAHMQSKDDVRFMTVGEFADKHRAGELNQTEDGWQVKETVSGETDQSESDA